jgi:uncharacterized OsmC-like protein
MTTEDSRRQVTLNRTRNSHYTAANARGGTISVGDGSDDAFTPVELLLTAIAGCSSIDVDLVTARRAEPDSFAVTVEATKIRDDQHGNRLTDISVSFRIVFPEGEDGADKARAILPDILKMSHERLCTVSHTVELGTPITFSLE